MKYEEAKQVGVNLKKGYNYDPPPRKLVILGDMVKRMIEQAERQMAGKSFINIKRKDLRFSFIRLI